MVTTRCLRAPVLALVLVLACAAATATTAAPAKPPMHAAPAPPPAAGSMALHVPVGNGIVSTTLGPDGQPTGQRFRTYAYLHAPRHVQLDAACSGQRAVFWVDEIDGYDVIMRSMLDGAVPEVMVNTATLLPPNDPTPYPITGMAVDSVSEMVFFAHRSYVMVARSDGVVVSDTLVDARAYSALSHVVLDGETRTLCFSAAERGEHVLGRVVCGGMDGTNMHTVLSGLLVESQVPSGPSLAADWAAGRLYVTNGTALVETELDGSGAVVVPTPGALLLAGAPSLALDATGDVLFVSQPSQLWRVNVGNDHFGASALVHQGSGMTSVAVGATHVYVTSYAIAPPATNAPAVQAAPLTDHATLHFETVLRPRFESVDSVAVDSARCMLYYLDAGAGELGAIELNGTRHTTLHEAKMPVRALVMDDAADELYWFEDEKIVSLGTDADAATGATPSTWMDARGYTPTQVAVHGDMLLWVDETQQWLMCTNASAPASERRVGARVLTSHAVTAIDVDQVNGELYFGSALANGTAAVYRIALSVINDAARLGHALDAHAEVVLEDMDVARIGRVQVDGRDAADVKVFYMGVTSSTHYTTIDLCMFEMASRDTIVIDTIVDARASADVADMMSLRFSPFDGRVYYTHGAVSDVYYFVPEHPHDVTSDVVSTLDDPTFVVKDPTAGVFLFADNTLNEIGLVQGDASTDSFPLSTFIMATDGDVSGLAVDETNEQLYVATNSGVSRVDYNGTLVTPLPMPPAVAGVTGVGVDTAGQRVYVATAMGDIYRMGLSGENPEHYWTLGDMALNMVVVPGESALFVQSASTLYRCEHTHAAACNELLRGELVGVGVGPHGQVVTYDASGVVVQVAPDGTHQTRLAIKQPFVARPESHGRTYVNAFTVDRITGQYAFGTAAPPTGDAGAIRVATHDGTAFSFSKVLYALNVKSVVPVGGSKLVFADGNTRNSLFLALVGDTLRITILPVGAAPTDHFYPMYLAFDGDTETVYWADKYASIGRMSVAQPNAQPERLLASPLQHGTAMAFHAAERTLYWLSAHNRRVMSSPVSEALSGVQVVAQDSHNEGYEPVWDARGIAVSADASQVFFSVQAQERFSSHINVAQVSAGTHTPLPIAQFGSVGPASLVVAGGELFYTDEHADAVDVMAVETAHPATPPTKVAEYAAAAGRMAASAPISHCFTKPSFTACTRDHGAVAEKTVASGTVLHEGGLVGDDLTFTVHPMNADGLPTSHVLGAFSALLVDKSEHAPAVVVSMDRTHNNNYTGSFVTTLAGDYALHILLNGYDIVDSPFDVHLLPLQPDVARSTCTAAVSRFTTDASGSTDVRLRDKYDNPVVTSDLEVTLNGCDDCAHTVHRAANSTLEVVYTVFKVGSVVADIQLPGGAVLCTQALQVLPGAAAADKSFAFDVTKKVESGVSNRFRVQLRDAHENKLATVAGLVEVIFRPQVGVQAQVTDAGDGVALVTYQSEYGGTYTVELLLAPDNTPIHGTPLTIDVSGPSAPGTGSKGLSGGAVAGIVIGAVLFGAAGMYVVRKKKAEDARSYELMNSLDHPA